MPLEVGEDDVTVGLPDDPGNLNRGKVPIIARDIRDVAAVEAVSDHDGTAEVFLGEAMLGRRLQTVGCRAATAGIQDGRIEYEGVQRGFTKPPDDFPGVSGVQKTVIPLLPPVDLYPHGVTGGKRVVDTRRAVGGAFPSWFPVP